MGLIPRSADYLTGMMTGPRYDRFQMAGLLFGKSDTAGNDCSQSGKNIPDRLQQPLELSQSNITPTGQPSDEAADIVDLIQSARNHFEKMIAAVRKRQPSQQKPFPAKESDLEPLTGGIAHTFSNLFMAIQGRISLMLLRTGPAHPFFMQLRRIEKLVQCESILANDILPHVAGRYCPLDPSSRRQLLDKIAQIPINLGVMYHLSEIENEISDNPELKAAEFQKLTVAVTCILKLLLSEINRLTDFMMSQTASTHSDFSRLLGIKAYIQKGHDRIRDLNECTGLCPHQTGKTRPQRLVEIIFDTFFETEPTLRLHISVANDLRCIKADSESIARVVNDLYKAVDSEKFIGGDLHISAVNAVSSDGEVDNPCHQDHVLISIEVSTRSSNAGKNGTGRCPGQVRSKRKFDNDLHLEGINGLIRSIGGRLSTICPPGTSAAFNVFLPALPPESKIDPTHQKSDPTRKVVYLKSDPDARGKKACIEPSLLLSKSAYPRQGKTASSSI